MASKPFKIILITFLLLSSSGCKKKSVINEKQAILFQLDYVNYAWGYQHNGYFIDSEGNILTYYNPPEWNFPDKELSLSDAQIAQNISRCIISGKKVPKDELQKYSNYIRNFASTKVSALKNEGAADAGSLEFICYQFMADKKSYKGTIIKMEGDFSCENLNFFTKKVTEWMRDINRSLAGN
jgi:hypothetical protein